MSDIEDDGPWFSGWVQCSMCGHRHVSVHPVDMVQNGECPECHNMTCEPEEAP